MTRRFLFLPLFALIIFAAYLGLQRGLLPSETDIINRYAAAYVEVAPSGADPSDCAATTHPAEAIRMVITCVHWSGLVTTYHVGPRGEALPAPTGPEA